VLIGVDALSLKPGKTGGGETYIVNLMRELPPMDPENHYHIFALPEAVSLFENGYPNVSIQPCRMPGPSQTQVWARILYEQAVLPGAIRRLGIQLMLFLGNMASIRCPCPSVMTVHDLMSYFYKDNYPGQLGLVKSRLLPAIVKASVRRVTLVSASSEHTKREIVGRLGVSAEKIRVVHLGVDPHFGGDRLGPEHLPAGIDASYALFVGTQDLHKSLDRLVRAFTLMKRRTKLPAKLVLAGMEGTGTAQLRATIRESNCPDVLDLGRVPDGQLSALYANAKLFVFPSLNEGFGLPPLEAMSKGIPVAASNAGPIPEVVADAAILFNPYDEESIASALERGFTDDALLESLREKGYERVRLFTWRRTAEKMFDIIRELSEKTAVCAG